MGSVCKAVPRNVRLADGLVEYELETPVNVLFTGGLMLQTRKRNRTSKGCRRIRASPKYIIRQKYYPSIDRLERWNG